MGEYRTPKKLGQLSFPRETKNRESFSTTINCSFIELLGDKLVGAIDRVVCCCLCRKWGNVSIGACSIKYQRGHGYRDKSERFGTVGTGYGPQRSFNKQRLFSKRRAEEGHQSFAAGKNSRTLFSSTCVTELLSGSVRERGSIRYIHACRKESETRSKQRGIESHRGGGGGGGWGGGGREAKRKRQRERVGEHGASGCVVWVRGRAAEIER